MAHYFSTPDNTISIFRATAWYLLGNACAHILTFRLTLYRPLLPPLCLSLSLSRAERSFIFEFFHILPNIKMPTGKYIGAVSHASQFLPRCCETKAKKEKKREEEKEKRHFPTILFLS